MRLQNPTPPSEQWYDNHELPNSWSLICGRLDGTNVLEVGCASGWVSRTAKKQGAVIVATDIFETMVHPDLDFVLACKEDLPFPDESFDYVVCSNTLHHGDLEAGITEIHRVLRVGGELISLIEPCIYNEVDEEELLERRCSDERARGIYDRMPNLPKWRKALSIFSNGYIFHTDTMQVVVEDNIQGSISIQVIK